MDWSNPILIVSILYLLTLGWRHWVMPIKDDDRDYGDLAYVPKPAVVTIDRMDLLMAEIRHYAELLADPEAIEIEYEVDFDDALRNGSTSLSAYESKRREEVIREQYAKIWHQALVIETEGRFEVRDASESQREALSEIWQKSNYEREILL